MSEADSAQGPAPRRVVVVEDDVLIAMMLEQVCEEAGFEVIGSVGDVDHAEQMLLEHRPSHLILDYRLGGERNGLDLWEAVKPHLPDLRVIVITGSNEPQTMSALRLHEPADLLVKPIEWSALTRALERSLA